MTFEELQKITDDALLVQKTYEIFNEDARLNHSKAARVEFLTNSHYIEQALKPGAKILDLGAGAGEYSLHFARKGYHVTALELADENIKVFRAKLKPEDTVELVQGNALDLSRWEKDTFDAVLVFGPLYHLRSPEDQKQVIREALRVCKPDGTLFFAFISNDMVMLTELMYDRDYLKGDTYDHDTFKVVDFPFVFHTVQAARDVLRSVGVNITKEVASDGHSELMANIINELDEESYTQYLRYHFYVCEKQELLGYSNHLLFVAKK